MNAYLYRLFLSLTLLVGFTASAHATVQGKEIHYADGGIEFHGYLAWNDAQKGKRPGVLVVHEWWGHNAYARRRATQLAELGYVALAVDMYGNGENTTNKEHAAHMMNAVKGDPSAVLQRFTAALNTLKAQPQTDNTRLAAIGYCFGGGVVLDMARAGLDLKGVVSFHGALATSNPAQPGKTKAQVLVYNGAADSFVPQTQIDSFELEMKNAGVRYHFVNLPNAKHGFSNPDATQIGKDMQMDIAYNAVADKTSWDGMQAFFRLIFK